MESVLKFNHRGPGWTGHRIRARIGRGWLRRRDSRRPIDGPGGSCHSNSRLRLSSQTLNCRASQGVWIGNDDGPIQYDDYDIARSAAQTVDVMLRQQPGRCRAKEYTPGPVRLWDEVPTVTSPSPN